ncbi:MAG: radical SAM family heme chaperone HemW [Verrucomicrobiota bacterium]
MLLYLHIPFCHRVCPYCSFYKHTPGRTPIGGFVAAVVKEAKMRVTEQPRTLYLGGGTPSMLSPAHLQKLFHCLAEIIDFQGLDEVTMEANPATFDERKAELFLQLGVRRISLGIQSFAAGVLQTLGREHDPRQAAEAVRILQKAGMPEVNIDLMFSIPGQTADDWKETLETAIALQPQHISAYNLTYEEDTAFFENLKRGGMDENEDRDADGFHLARRMLEEAGFIHYETSNYARAGAESSHNRGYWRGEDYIGLGPSAVSTVARVRTTNVADTAAYISRMNSLGHAADAAEEIGDDAWRMERIAIGLRTVEGIPGDLLDRKGMETARNLAEHGILEIRGNSVVVTGRGKALVDIIAGELI